LNTESTAILMALLTAAGIKPDRTGHPV